MARFGEIDGWMIGKEMSGETARPTARRQVSFAGYCFKDFKFEMPSSRVVFVRHNMEIAILSKGMAPKHEPCTLHKRICQHERGSEFWPGFGGALKQEMGRKGPLGFAEGGRHTSAAAVVSKRRALVLRRHLEFDPRKPD